MFVKVMVDFWDQFPSNLWHFIVIIKNKHNPSIMSEPCAFIFNYILL